MDECEEETGLCSELPGYELSVVQKFCSFVWLKKKKEKTEEPSLYVNRQLLISQEIMHICYEVLCHKTKNLVT